MKVYDDILIAKAVWTPPKRATRAAALIDYEKGLEEFIGDDKPDLAVVEELSVTRGHKTVRALSHFEAASYMVFERRQIPIMTIKATTARYLVLGLQIGKSKEEALAAVRMAFPDIRWSPINQGGGDEADAFVLAKAGPLDMRRR